jgi:MFS family permease
MSAASIELKRDNAFPWLIITAGCVLAILTIGPRSALGLFQLPLISDRSWDRQTFGLAIALQNLFWGLGQPFFGAIADRYGSWKVLLLSAIFFAAGFVLMATGTTPLLLYIGGSLIGLGIGAGGFGILLSAFARHVTSEQRSFAFGLGTAAGSAGMFIFAPLSQEFISRFGWSQSLIIIASMMVVIPFLAIPLRGNSSSGKTSKTEIQQSIGQALREAFGHQSYLLLTAGFFVCGFQVAFITAHFPAYLGDIGIEAKYAAISLALIGFFNIFGSLGAGIMGQKYSKPYLLAYIYIGRSIAVTLFLLLPQTPLSVIIFASVMGILWLSTVPPTNALVAIMFGTRHLGLLGGLVFLSHQVGSFIGIWMGGYLYNHFGTYDPVWWIGVALGLFAAAVHWPIREKPVERGALLAPAE